MFKQDTDHRHEVNEAVFVFSLNLQLLLLMLCCHCTCFTQLLLVLTDFSSSSCNCFLLPHLLKASDALCMCLISQWYVSAGFSSRGGARGKVRGSLKPLGFSNGEQWMFVQTFLVSPSSRCCDISLDEWKLKLSTCWCQGLYHLGNMSVCTTFQGNLVLICLTYTVRYFWAHLSSL